MIECAGLVHIYKTEDVEVVALQGLDMGVEEGEMIAIVGASGSGKTTLMNVLSGVERPSAGRAVVAGMELVDLDERARNRYRREVVGYVWQQALLNAVPVLSVEQNLQVPMLATAGGDGGREARARELLAAIGLEHRRRHLPAQLSGGERQLLAIAVALANRPRVLLADEPTAGLDRAAAGRVLATLGALRSAMGTTVVMVTHDLGVTAHVDRVLRIRDGRVATETRSGAGERVVVDRAGRLQLPRHLVDEVGLGALAQVRREGRSIIVEPADE